MSKFRTYAALKRLPGFAGKRSWQARENRFHDTLDKMVAEFFLLAPRYIAMK